MGQCNLVSAPMNFDQKTEPTLPTIESKKECCPWQSRLPIQPPTIHPQPVQASRLSPRKVFYFFFITKKQLLLVLVVCIHNVYHRFIPKESDYIS